jgi:PBSX family phage terminase large subunit
MIFQLTDKQQEAQQYLSSDATHICLFGGSRSGKTFLLVRNIVMRALKAPKSRHAIFRFRFNAIKASIIMDTFPRVMEVAYHGVQYELNKTDFFAEFANGSQIWFGGLDDKERTEKILGMEFVTIYYNEASQIPYSSIELSITRLAQKAMQAVDGMAGIELKPRCYYDLNPPSKAHWSYKKFIEKRDPETRKPLENPGDYASFRINPVDNQQNLSTTYLATLNAMSARAKQRFLYGEFADATPNALFTFEAIENNRMYDGSKLPQLLRIIVGVDPSGADETDNAENDAIGIVVGGLGLDGKAYLLEDCTVVAGPATWGRIATTAYDRHQGDCIVAEMNFGGAMVRHVIQTARPNTPFRAVTASRGKHIRAEPFSSLYEQGRVVHVGNFPELEDEMTAFNTMGYLGDGSPNRADAWFWVLAELFSGIVTPRKIHKPIPHITADAVTGY